MKLTALVPAICLVILACNTPDPLAPTPISQTQTPVFDAKLISNDWSVDSVRVSKMDTLTTTSIYSKAYFVYARQSPASVADFSKFQLKLNQDGSFNQADTDGSKSSGAWSMIDGGATLRLENKDTQLIEHYTIAKLDSNTLSFNVEIPKGTTFVDLDKRWTSRLGSVYGLMVSNRPLIAIIKMSHQ